MIGEVDAHNRALLNITVSNAMDGRYSSVTAWIDTAFDGCLVIPAKTVDHIQLEPLAKTEAVLADGTLAVLDTYVCYIDWFGNRLPVPAMSGDGEHTLLGTGLLEQRELHISYKQRTLTLD